MGQWAAAVGAVPGDFDGCPQLCGVGYYATLDDHTDPTCGAECPTGSYCPKGSVAPMCDRGFYDADANSTVSCKTCPVGTDCHFGSTLAELPLRVGYYRPDDKSFDVGRCPDAGVNCGGKLECGQRSNSGCRGGTSNPCAATLDGPFCLLCEGSDRDGGANGTLYYYVAATNEEIARCEPCGDIDVGSMVGVVILILFLLALIVGSVMIFWYRSTQKLKDQLLVAKETYTPHIKLKCVPSLAMHTPSRRRTARALLPLDVASSLA